MNKPSSNRISDIFSRDEIKQLTTRSDVMGWWAVLSTWAIIASAFATVAWASQHLSSLGLVLVMLLALIVIAGRQLCLAIMMHDAAHGTLFANKRLNQLVGTWLCAKPIWNDLNHYRPYHLQHHAKTSSDEDPDRCLIADLPTTKASLMRKFLRDILGLTGLKFLVGRLLMDLEVLQWSVTNNIVKIPQQTRSWWNYPIALLKNSYGMLITNGVIFAILASLGYAWLYSLWVLAYITPFPLFIRIRNMAEHACTQRSSNMFDNTRTTHAGLIARATVAPLRVNYHREHHLMAGVPYFNLPVMHKILLEKGKVEQAPSYVDVLKMVSAKSLNH